MSGITQMYFGWLPIIKTLHQSGMCFVSIFRSYTQAVLFLNDEFLLRINNSLQIIPSHRQGYARPF